ncbi:CinA family nicotinamide mononucleotide deamidase-related protein [Thermogutta sp.]|uniref:competence/damage-inducible protein A n=1 Tax=Thermogutta sp. TaxID=1962930 RepID=UPI0032206261
MDQAMQGEIIAIGDEITSGRILDTNSQWLSVRLEDLGIRVLFHTVVGDELQAMVAVFRQAIDRSDVVITTGGLGPTADDLTREALANATGRQLVEYPEALEHIRQFFQSRQRPMPERNRVQAVFPAGSEMIHNPRGTAPGIFLAVPRAGRSPCYFSCLPGVPAEMREMWPQVEKRLRNLGAGREYILHRDIKCFGAGESQVEAMLPDLIRRGRDPLVGINASQNTIILRISTRGANREECEAKVEPVVRTIYSILGDLIFGENETELQDVVVAQLRDKGLSFALIETTTAGLVSQWLRAAEKQQDRTYRGGLVVEDLATAEELLAGVSTWPKASKNGEPDSALRVARASLAQHLAQVFGAEIGAVAGPLQFLNEEGTLAEFPLVLSQGDRVLEKTIRFSSHPDFRQITVAKHILNTLRLWLKNGT